MEPSTSSAGMSEQTPLIPNEDEKAERGFPKFICHFTLLSAFLVLLAAATFFAVKYFLATETQQHYLAQKRHSDRLMSITFPLKDIPEESAGLEFSDFENATKAISMGKHSLLTRFNMEKRLESVPKGSPSYKHQRAAVVFTTKGADISNLGFIENAATKALGLKRAVLNYEKAGALAWASETGCAKRKKCLEGKYRSLDGSCNNGGGGVGGRWDWGAAMRPFRRALPPVYQDGVSEPRGGFQGNGLPSARTVSATVNRPLYKEDSKFTVMLAVWGQFLDHDITATASTRSENGETISCCGSSTGLHPECFPVLLDPTDEYYVDYNISCMEFIRSAPALRCSFGPREQLNQASSFIDASVVYGNDLNLTSKLRTFQGGEMKVLLSTDGRELLPISTDPDNGCNVASEIKRGRYCFISGDPRANENLHLTSMHLIFVRHHNKVARKLKVVNPEWGDEEIFQETRRIIWAQMQHVTYNEFLPVLLGPEMMEKLRLRPLASGFWTGYDATLNPEIANNFASASFRFAHSIIPRMMKFLANDTSSPEYAEMSKMLFNPFRLYENATLGSVIRGAISTHIQKSDSYFTDQLTKHLFEVEENGTTMKSLTCGLDLVALNIQRGRDHGLPTYPNWRQYCGFERPVSFEDLKFVFDSDSLKAISSIYLKVDDIDLYTGALAEIPVEGGILGPTLTCLISDQFLRIKSGDRFWYETGQKPQAFSEVQLTEIRKTSLAGILCDNSDDLSRIQPQVMRSTHDGNQVIPCAQIPRPDLNMWAGWYERITLQNENVIESCNISIIGGTVTSNGHRMDITGNIPMDFENAVLIWKGWRKKGRLGGFFQMGTRMGVYDLLISVNSTCQFNPNCSFHAGIQFGSWNGDWSALKDSVIESANFVEDIECSIIAAVILDGFPANSSIFSWNGYANVLTSITKSVRAFREESYMSLDHSGSMHDVESHRYSANDSELQSTENIARVASVELFVNFGNRSLHWWSGALPPFVFLPLTADRELVDIFPNVLSWTFSPLPFEHAFQVRFFTYGPDSKMLIHGEAIVNASKWPFHENITYISPIFLHEGSNDGMNNDKRIPILLLGEAMEKKFLWNGYLKMLF